MQSEDTIQIHQALHGYANGHSLLAASLQLPHETERTLLVLSDMSGSSMIRGFESYLTGYPLDEIASYALERTWYAPEMKRPGCVWTHTLIIANADLARLPDLQVLLKLFKRPEGAQSKKEYNSPLSIIASLLTNPTERDFYVSQSLDTPLAAILRALYGEPNKPIYIPLENAEDYESLVLSIWTHQWPKLRRTFSFCTGSIANRKINGGIFDLQIIPWKSVGQIRREVKAGIFLDLSEWNANANYPAWVSLLLKDLFISPPRTKLEEFLWNFGVEHPHGRSVVPKLAEIFACVQEADNKALSIKGLIEKVSQHFPSAHDAPLLKRTIFGSEISERTWMLPHIQEEDMLRDLCRTKYYSTFDIRSLKIRQRAETLLKISPDKTLQLTLDLFTSDINPLGEEFLIGISKATPVAEIDRFSASSRGLLYVLLRHNPVLASSASLWQTTADEQREILDTVTSSPEFTLEMVKPIIVAILDSGSDSIASEVVRHFGALAVKSVLDWLSLARETPFSILGKGWTNALRSQPDEILNWLQSAEPSHENTFAWAASLLDPDSSLVLSYGAAIWLPLAKNALSKVQKSKLTETMAFLLALGLNNPGPGSAELVAYAFETVHNAAANEALGYHSWQHLKDKLPHLSWWREWDRCERLRQALVEYFIKYSWPLDAFLRAIQSPRTFDLVIDYCRTSKRTKRLVREAVEQLAKGKISATNYQEKALREYF